MIGIRQKLMLGFGGLFAIIVLVDSLTMVQIGELGNAIDMMLKENYRSVAACQDMKDSLERMNSGALFILAGNPIEGNRLIREYALKFPSALHAELVNITLPGEREKAEKIRDLFGRYIEAIPLAAHNGQSIGKRQTDYFEKILPLFKEIKSVTNDILLMNQANMNEANALAHQRADKAHRIMLTAILFSAFIAFLFSYLSHRWILRPILRLNEYANEIRSGNLDLVVDRESNDEIGQLSYSFNEMAASLRKVRKEEKVNLMRTKRVTEEVFQALPVAIAVFDLDGKVEMSTETADLHFGLKPGVLAEDLEFDWLPPLIRKTMAGHEFTESNSKTIQQFIDHREYFFQPLAMPILVGPGSREATGVALILKDVTQVHEQQEMKRDVVSTVSHQLKTPLSSIRMSIYLLLEERIGPLNEKQVELLMAARDDTDRLTNILNDLLNINRIESGKSMIASKPVTPSALVRDILDPYLIDAKDRGVTLVNAVTENLPEVMADTDKIRHVFANLLSNALRFTAPGGSVTISAEQKENQILFPCLPRGIGSDFPFVQR